MASSVDSKKIWMWVGIAVAVLLVLGAGIWYFTSASQVAVPDVTGKQAADAVRTLQAAGLVLGATTQQESTSTAPGTILDQTPHAGLKVKKGSPVAIVVAKAQSAVSVPNVVGMTETAASDAVKAAGLKPVPYSDYNTSTPTGQVFGQVPAAGTQAAPGSEIAIGVSLGKTPTAPKVPNVVGMSAADAQTTLKNDGFGVHQYSAYSDTVASGKVISQLPAAGEQALAGSVVGIQVSQGKAPTPTTLVTVPNVTGQSQANATSALQKAGLGVDAISEYSDTVPKGNVIGQLPAAGAKVAGGTVIGIAVSKGKATQYVTVPDVVGKSSTDATKALDAAGLKAQVAEEYSDTVEKGIVIAQLPVGGSAVPPNSLVVIEVSKGAKPVATPY